ncbi:G-protein coupled receptor Mth2-like [Sitodiplosis mosellana]|uniref:G-protein coupled receptor Mth2-like n=1 Tax=Sitodiplosis mosellana TaxID=263140 RepID=UPI002444CDBF|nr:G-protein coupled receptor Mth2-like [Sitodiplosis mosellana]
MPYLLFISVPFTMATFFVYILIPDLRNLHGKCLLCYLVSLVIFQPLFGWIYINDDRYVKPLPCKLVGYTTYFASQSVFLWLSVISFDLWWNFSEFKLPNKKTSGFMLSEKKRFIFYTIYALGLSLLMTLLTLTMDYIPGIPKTFQPLMGVHMCFLQKEWNTRLFYFYLPQFILCSVNILFFVLTAFKIRLLQIDLNKVMAQGENGKHQCRLQSEKENFNLFLRLFIVMGVIWFMESFSFLVDSESIYFFFFDVWNCLQGVLIFAFMVCKRRMFRLIKKRYQAIIKKSTASSITTNSSSVTYATNNIALNQMTAKRDKYTEKL